MIQDNLKVGMIVAFKHNDEVIRGVLHAWDGKILGLVQ